ncbi:hypothetical protein [Agrobacterium vitis]|uniref:Helix-turn-helix domain-containing protein n=1 Tax=Agrobacterium vitis TaxID=373 RepID=A0AAE2RHH4_AGRVI|nr:hypothetical protein [Agrobacterium vitis]MBF2717509.1 hypothetical protein [Agrobacterium vitis]
MSEAFPISAALARNLASRPKMSPSDIAIMNGYLTGTMPTQPASKQPTTVNLLSPHLRRMQRLVGRKWQRSPDRAASMGRKRKLGGSSGMPDTIRHHYTEGERAALTVIAGEVKHHGLCDLALDRIAAVAGVSRTTVQNAIREARALGHLSVEPRPRKGQKNLTNLVRIVSAEWMTWLKRGPSLARQTGFKDFHPTKNQDKINNSRQCKSRQDGASRKRCMGLGEGESSPVAGNNGHRGRGNG